MIDDQGEKYPNRIQAYDGREGLLVVNPVGLSKAAGHEACLVTIDRAVGVVLQSEDPSAGNNIGILWTRNQDPCTTVGKGRELLIHGRLPVWNRHSLHVGPRNRLGGEGEGEGMIGGVQVVIVDVMRNGMEGTSTCTFAKCDG